MSVFADFIWQICLFYFVEFGFVGSTMCWSKCPLYIYLATCYPRSYLLYSPSPTFCRYFAKTLHGGWVHCLNDFISGLEGDDDHYSWRLSFLYSWNLGFKQTIPQYSSTYLWGNRNKFENADRTLRKRGFLWYIFSACLLAVGKSVAPLLLTD